MRRGTTETTAIARSVEHETSNTNVYSSPCCSNIHQGCTVDHGLPWWAGICSEQSGEIINLPMWEDSASEYSWIPQKIVKQLQYPVYDIKERPAVVNFNGKVLTSTKWTRIILNGTGPSGIEFEFKIPPERFPCAGALLGRDFIGMIGHANQHFYNKPGMVKNIKPGVIRIIASASITKNEQLDIKETKEVVEKRAPDLAQK